MKRLAILTCVAGAALLMAAPAPARPTFGVVNQGALGDRDFARMHTGGVATLRFLIRWGAVEPGPGVYDWSAVDAIVARARAQRIRLLPMVYGVPPWLDPHENHPPLATAAERTAWQSLLAALAGRYGPGGEFFAGGSEWPIRRWQIWNEPNFAVYWQSPQSPRDYGRLVRLSAAALRGVDPDAKVVLAGVAAVRDGIPWAEFLRRLYEVPHIRRSFDLVALHPYSDNLRVLRAQLDRIRRLLARAGNPRARLAVTEIGWASDGERPRPLVVGRRRQAELLRSSFDLLSQRGNGWRISDVLWYAWQDTRAIEGGCVFCEYAGLFDSLGRPKPAWRAFRLAVSRRGGGAGGRGGGPIDRPRSPSTSSPRTSAPG